MIEFIFTLDYEIYGNGTGALKDLVYDPAELLRDIFKKWNARFVNFVEVAEFDRIEASGVDPAIDLVKKQIKDLGREGFEIGLHLHPQWYNARHENGHWLLDYSEYNLCTLPKTRIAQIVKRAVDYVRYVVDESDFTPLSFRAGNWLFQPTKTAAGILASHGIKVDSSVFKGGLQHNCSLDYRRAQKNGYYWTFDKDVNEPDPTGKWVEVPIHTEMVRFWRMATTKRMGFTNSFGIVQGRKQKLNRILDFLRLRYPLKLDFCRMTLEELRSMVERVIQEDKADPASYRPLVAIGHTKDLTDPQTVDDFLSYLHAKKVAISTFGSIYDRLLTDGFAGVAVGHSPQKEPEVPLRV
jgi:hypothetical protein